MCEHLAKGNEGLGSGTTRGSRRDVLRTTAAFHYRRLCTSSSTGLKIRGKTGLTNQKGWITKLYVSA